MSVKLYDDALIEKLKYWTEDTMCQIVGPEETRELFEIKADKNDDKPIKSKTPKIVIENNNYINTQTGEILGQTEDKQNNDKELVNKLNSLLVGKLEVKL